MIKTGLFGGTFNPVHQGHLRAAQEVAEEIGLASVIFMPAARPPHKPSENLAPYESRVAMLGLAVAKNPLFEVSTLEGELPGPSYTVETLKELTRRLEPGASVYFIIGAEAFSEIGTWKEPGELFSLASFVVVERPGFSAREILGVARAEISGGYSLSEDGKSLEHPELGPIRLAGVTLFEISGTMIRARLKKEKSIKYLVPEEVEEYIIDNGLYR